jgi:uncharacterized protein (TIGR03083 family)
MCAPGLLGHHRAMETDLLEELWGRMTAAVTALDEAAYDVPTRAAGWCVRDLLFHQLLDAQRALVALASPTDAAADVDAVSYWAPFHPAAGDGGRAHAAFVRAAAAAYRTGAGLAGQWRETSQAAVRAARAADPRSRVRTQGHVLTVADLVSTLVVEATVHLLDLTVGLPDPPAPPPAALRHTRGVLEASYGGPLPAAWDDTEAVLRGTGRLPADDPRLPLLG